MNLFITPIRLPELRTEILRFEKFAKTHDIVAAKPKNDLILSIKKPR